MARPERRPPGRASIGLPLALVLLGVLRADANLGLTAFAVAAEIGLPGLRLPSRTASLLADLVTVLFVLLVLLVLARIRRPRGRGTLLVTLLAVALVGLQLGAAVARSVTGGLVPTDLYIARAVLLAAATVAALDVLGSLVHHRETVSALREAAERAGALEGSGRTARARLREEVATEVRDVLREALDALAGGTTSGSAAHLRSLADDVIRPLSHRLAAAPVADAESRVSITPPRWRDTLRALARTPVVPPRTLALVAAGLAQLRTFVTDQDAVRGIAPALDPALDPVFDGPGPSAIGISLTVDWGSLLMVVGELGLVLLVTWWGAARFADLLDRRRAGLPPLVAWTATVLGLLAVALLTLVGPAVFELLTGVTRVGPAPTRLLASFVPLLGVTLGVSVVAAIEDGRDALETDLARQRDDLARAAARLQAVLGHEQQRLARTLHADVQASVNAASLLLDRAARDGDGMVGPELIDDVAARIATSVERFLRGGSSGRPVVERLDEVRALWQGVCTVTLDVAEDVPARVDDDVVTRDLLVDLVAEACANAVVHGGASGVKVRIALEGSGDVALIVEDDGTRGADRGDAAEGRAEGRGGLGSAVLRASCTRFALQRSEEGSVLSASIPLG